MTGHEEPTAGGPWYRRIRRWGQTNLTEKDPVRYDAAWWRDYWRRTGIQGVIVNAGGIVAYYPSRHPQHQAAYLGAGDLYGDIVADARADGLAVLARMDSNRAGQDLYDEHPDWFAVASDGTPYRAGELYIACVSGPYYRDFLPGVLTEIIERSSPEGITDNSWSGLPRDRICYCANCRRSFAEATGEALPLRGDWGDPAYRQWIDWSYRQRLAIWDLNNEVTRSVGGADCLWIGMNGGDPAAQAHAFRDYREICRRTPIIMLDSQFRRDPAGFQTNADSGKLIHQMLGWDAVVPESTAMYDGGVPTFRLGSKPAPEARMWAVEGFAAGISPWWHHIGAHHEDRRQYATAEPLFTWHSDHAEALRDRVPVATVGVVWSQRSIDFHGRDQPEVVSTLPYRGVVDALIRDRIPYLPVHADDLAEQAHGFAALVVPNVGVLTDEQVGRLAAYARSGGALVVTGESGRYDEWGEPRRSATGELEEVLGIRRTEAAHGELSEPAATWESYAAHTHLRRESGGPAEPFDGLGDTDLLPFGGRLEVVEVEPAAAADVPLTWVPPFPIYPPEKAWMRRDRTALPALVTRDPADAGRTAYFAADIDRGHGRHHHPDHGRLLAGVVRWAARGDVPLAVEGAGVLDCHLYRRGTGLVLHLVNLDQGGAWRGRLSELTPNGPYRVRLRVSEGVPEMRARLLVAGTTVDVERTAGSLTIDIPRIADHEVVVLE